MVSLAGCHTVDLSFCTALADVSALGKVTKLKLKGCPHVSNVSALGNVDDLDLS